MKSRTRSVLYGTFAAALVVPFMVYLFVAVPESWTNSMVAFYGPLILLCEMAIFNTGAAVLFLTGLGVYKSKMRVAYTALAIASILTTLGTIQVPILAALNIFSSLYGRSGGIALPFVLGGTVMYMSTRAFAKLVQTQTILTRADLVFPLALLLSLSAAFLPHIRTHIPEFEYAANNMLLFLSGFLNLASALVISKVKKHIGEHYVNAMSWLSFPLFMTAAILGAVTVQGLISNAVIDPALVVIYCFTAINSAIWLRAAYAFVKTEEY